MLTVNQFGALGIIGGDCDIAKPSYISFMADCRNSFRTFKHSALNGFMAGLFFELPVKGTNALHEKRSFKYALFNGGFWIVCRTIMGGIIYPWK